MNVRFDYLKYTLVAAMLLVGLSGCGEREARAIGAPDRHAIGSVDAAVTLLAFDDYQ